jgi:hypothetical protein
MQQYPGQYPGPYAPPKRRSNAPLIVALVIGLPGLALAGCITCVLLAPTSSKPPVAEKPAEACGGTKVEGRECLVEGGRPRAIALDEEAVYLADEDGTVRRIDRAGKELTSLATVSGAEVMAGDLAVDGRDVYLIDREHEQLLRIDKKGGTPESVGKGEKLGQLRAARSPDGRVCMLGTHPKYPFERAVMCITERGAALRVVSTVGRGRPTGFGLDGDDIYIAYEPTTSRPDQREREWRALYRAPLNGGAEPTRVTQRSGTTRRAENSPKRSIRGASSGSCSMIAPSTLRFRSDWRCSARPRTAPPRPV